MQLYGHKQHNYRNDANFRKLTGKVLCIAFLRFLILRDFFRNSATLYHIRYCDNELLYCLSVKIFERKFCSQVTPPPPNLPSKRQQSLPFFTIYAFNSRFLSYIKSNQSVGSKLWGSEKWILIFTASNLKQVQFTRPAKAAITISVTRSKVNANL